MTTRHLLLALLLAGCDAALAPASDPTESTKVHPAVVREVRALQARVEATEQQIDALTTEVAAAQTRAASAEARIERLSAELRPRLDALDAAVFDQVTGTSRIAALESEVYDTSTWPELSLRIAQHEAQLALLDHEVFDEASGASKIAALLEDVQNFPYEYATIGRVAAIDARADQQAAALAVLDREVFDEATGASKIGSLLETVQQFEFEIFTASARHASFAERVERDLSAQTAQLALLDAAVFDEATRASKIDQIAEAVRDAELYSYNAAASVKADIARATAELSRHDAALFGVQDDGKPFSRVAAAETAVQRLDGSVRELQEKREGDQRSLDALHAAVFEVTPSGEEVDRIARAERTLDDLSFAICSLAESADAALQGDTAAAEAAADVLADLTCPQP